MIRGGEDHLGSGWNRILSRPRSGGGFKFKMRDMHSFIIAATYYTVRDSRQGPLLRINSLHSLAALGEKGARVVDWPYGGDEESGPVNPSSFCVL